MLPAVSANLPVYLLPPQGSGTERAVAMRSPFGPAARLELSGSASEAAARAGPANGLYGPDGQFVESAVRRETNLNARSDGQTEAGRSHDRAGPRKTSHSEETRNRDLSLSNADVAVPPAAREELVELIDRLKSREGSRHFDADDYKRIARLMERVGRYDDAAQARDRADELNGTESGRG